MKSAHDSSRLARLAEVLPVVAAFGLYAVAHDRWVLAAPVALGIAVAAYRRVALAHTSGRLLLGAVLGMGAGVLLLVWGGPLPDSPIPPQVLNPLCGALVGLSALCALTRKRAYAWIYACILAVLSLDGPFTRGVAIALAVLAVSLLAVVFLLDGPARAGWRGGVTFAVFVALVGGAGAGLVVVIRASEGMLVSAVYQLMRDPDGPSGPGLQTEIGLAAISKVRGGTRVLMELSGERPTRLRTNVFDQFNGMRWTTSPGLSNTVLRMPAPKSPEAGAFETELTLLEPMGAVLPAPGGTFAVEGAQPQVIGGWLLRATRMEGLTLKLRADRGERLPAEPAPPDVSLLALPADLRAELRPLAAELIQGAKTPREMAERIARTFRDEYEYSLDVNLGGRDHPLVVLIRDRKPAYCSYFASAMAALLRTLDVPARVVGGFAPQEENPLTGATVVRERDAHAWVEVYLADEGRFVAFDPTPWQSRDAALGLDDDKPGVVGNVFRAVMSFLRKLVAAAKADPSGYLWSLVKSPLFFVPALALVLWRVVGRRREQRARGPRAAMEGTDPVAKAAYGQYLRVLKRVAGIVPQPSETDDELLSRLREARGEQVAQVASEFIARYREARYRGTQSAPEPLAELVTKLGAELRRGSDRR